MNEVEDDEMIYVQDVSDFPDLERARYERFVCEVQSMDLPTLPVIEIETHVMHNETLTQSKIGGIPFVQSLEKLPLDANGDPMVMVLQVNLAELPKEQTIFPVQEGLLQFWIPAYHEGYGLPDYESAGKPYSKLLYHTDLTTQLSLHEINRYIQTQYNFEDIKYNMPFSKVLSLSYTLSEQVLTPSDYRFNDTFVPVWNKANPDFQIETFFDLDDYDGETIFYTFMKEEPNHQLGGYPHLTQLDKREFDESIRAYSHVLFQIDSDTRDEHDIIWGDVGTAQVYIKPEDLAVMKFDDYRYYADWS